MHPRARFRLPPYPIVGLMAPTPDPPEARRTKKRCPQRGEWVQRIAPLLRVHRRPRPTDSDEYPALRGAGRRSRHLPALTTRQTSEKVARTSLLSIQVRTPLAASTPWTISWLTTQSVPAGQLGSNVV